MAIWWLFIELEFFKVGIRTAFEKVSFKRDKKIWIFDTFKFHVTRKSRISLDQWSISHIKMSSIFRKNFPTFGLGSHTDLLESKILKKCYISQISSYWRETKTTWTMIGCIWFNHAEFSRDFIFLSSCSWDWLSKPHRTRNSKILIFLKSHVTLKRI